MGQDRSIEPFPLLDRAAHRRTDETWLQQQLLNGSRVLVVWNGMHLFQSGERNGPFFLSSSEINNLQSPIFLGVRPDGAAVFVHHHTGAETEEEALAALGLNKEAAKFVQLREYQGALTPEERSALFYSRSLANWHREQKFCHRCGHSTVPGQGGHVMVCTNPECATMHFPRSDPATIMLVHREDCCLLGRQAAWPEGVYSTLAGFVEAGETAEEAVRREVKEESGIEIDNIRYYGSQPWPFPQSLMLGFHAEAVTSEITCGSELADVRWFNVDETRKLVLKLANRFPHLDTIARRLIRHWLNTK